ncbi:MAG: DMT family transporter [Planctomycetes bacterium]|nr:DMT family transporter [Planctomycetota bacterium]
MPYVLFSLIVLIWSASFLLMKKAALVFGPITIGGWRVFTGALALGILWRFKRGGPPVKRRHLLPLLLVVVAGNVVPYSVQPFLVKLHGSGFIGMMVGFVPLLTILVSIPMLRLFPTPRQVLGVLGGLVCVGLVMYDGKQRDVSMGHLALAVLVPFSYAISNSYIKRRFADASSLGLTYASLALSSVVLLPLGMLTEPMKDLEHLALASVCVALLGVFGTGLAVFMFYKLVKDHGPLFAGMVTYLVPVGAILWGWMDAEEVTQLQLIALAGVFAMVALVQWGAARRAAAPSPAPAASSESADAA